MTREETKQFMKRIKQHYQEFMVDDFRVNEWYKALKNYDLDDVNDKLDEHLKNETYGNQIPKVYFIIKYLKTTEEKNNEKNKKAKLECPLCREWILMNDFDKHYEKCSSVNYFIKQYKKYYGKELDRNKLMAVSSELFEENYTKLLRCVQKSTEDENETKIIGYIFNSPNENVKIAELYKKEL